MNVLIQNRIKVGKYVWIAVIALNLLVLWDAVFNYGNNIVDFLFYITGG